MLVKKILEAPSKTNSSYGNWAIWVTLENTVNGHTYTVDEALFFWTKKEAKAVKVGDKVQL